MIPAFSFRFNQKIIAKRVTIGRYDGIHPCLTFATIGNKVFVHNPHNRAGVAIGNKDVSVLDVSQLNINQTVNCICAGKMNQDSPNDFLVVLTTTSLLIYDVHKNTDVFYKEIADGCSTVTIGSLGNSKDHLAIVGGNCAIQGFDIKGNDAFWTITGDNVTALCLADYNNSGQNQLLVGSEDFDIRVFENDELIGVINETETVSGLCAMGNGRFGYSLSNGTIGVYEKTRRLWRIKSKNQAVCVIGYDINDDGLLELVTGWSNGKVDARNALTGEVIFKDNFSQSLAGIVIADYRMKGEQELICCSVDGEVRGYLPSRATGPDVPVDFSTEQETIRDLTRKKQAMLMELRNYEDSFKLTTSGNEGSAPKRPSSSKEPPSAIPADTQLQTGLAINLGSGSRPPHVEIALATNNDTIIRAVTVFAEGIFPGESLVAHPNDEDVSSSIRVPMCPLRDVPVDLHLQVLVGNRNSRQFHVFELTRQLPRFSMYALCPEPKTKPNGKVTIRITERMQRVLLWINQSFLLAEDLTLQKNEIKLSFLALRTNGYITLTMDSSGTMNIGTDDVSLAGEIIQSMASSLNIENLQVTADFPQEMATLKTVMQQVEELNATRQTMMADMADNSGLVKSLVVRAEDARLMGDLKSMQYWYCELRDVNRDLINSYNIRSNNHQQLLSCLRQLNQIIQRASHLRVGKPKLDLVAECRAAVKCASFNVLLKVLASGSDGT